MATPCMDDLNLLQKRHQSLLLSQSLNTSLHFEIAKAHIREVTLDQELISRLTGFSSPRAENCLALRRYTETNIVEVSNFHILTSLQLVPF
jgi:hypothetical protein